MIVASGLTGALVFAANPHWSFWTSWLVGVVNSATDPVAVVALLKDLGASKKLATLIEGESLLNDGSAVVLFVWVKNVIGYDHATKKPSWMEDDMIGLELLRVIAQMLVFGILLGWFFGFVTKCALRFVYNDRIIETSILVGTSYLAFWLSELYMGTSAVLVVVFMGLYMNKYKSAISPDCLEFIHEFFSIVAHILNTYIFVIAGCRLGTIIAESAISRETIWNTGSSLVMGIYPMVLLTRGVTFLLCYPLLKRIGTPVDWKDAVVMWWGGLRGSVGLALALVISHTAYDSYMWAEKFDANGAPVDYQVGDGGYLHCRDAPFLFLMMTCVVITMTVVVNGMTMMPLMQKLGMTELSEERKFMMLAMHESVETETRKYVNLLKFKDRARADVDWEVVSKFINMPPPNYECLDEETSAWLQILNLERCAYLEQFEQGTLGSEAFAVLEDFMADLVADAHAYVDMEVKQYEHDKRRRSRLTSCKDLDGQLEGKKRELQFEEEEKQTRFQALSDLYDVRFSKMLDSVTSKRSRFKLVIAYEVGLAYLEGQQLVDQAGAAEVKVGQKVFARVVQAHEDNKELILQKMKEVEDKAPLPIRRFKTFHTAQLILQKQRKMIDHMQMEGDLLDMDAATTRERINAMLRKLYRQPIIDFFFLTTTKLRKSMATVTPIMDVAMQAPQQQLDKTRQGMARVMNRASPHFFRTPRAVKQADEKTGREGDTQSPVPVRSAKVRMPVRAQSVDDLLESSGSLKNKSLSDGQ